MSRTLRSIVVPSLLRQINERKIVKSLQSKGEATRSRLSRETGISYPTVSKITAQLMESNILEEVGVDRSTTGRPATILRLARDTVQVIGATICPESCDFVAAGLDGKILPQYSTHIPTPSSYPKLLEAIARQVTKHIEGRNVPTLGLGVSVPGILNYRDRRVDVSPAIHQLDGHRFGDDLRAKLGLETVVVQSMHAVFLAEHSNGPAQGVDNFAIIGIAAGLGLVLCCGGRLVEGHHGLAGELGHIIIDPEGKLCGCGKRGCLETVATDSALAAAASKKIGRSLTIDEVVSLVQKGRLDLDEEIETFVRYLSHGLSIVINLFSPEYLFIYGRYLDLHEEVFTRLVQLTEERSMASLFGQCSIVRTERKLHEGSVTAIIHHLTDQLEIDVM